MKKLTTEEFISKAILVHGDEYDYSKTVYNGNRTNVIITCKIHGNYSQSPKVHLIGGRCPICAHKIERKYGISNTLSRIDKQSEEFLIWHLWNAILYRCHYTDSYPAYRECSVCKEWEYYANFKEWFDKNSHDYKKGYHLDKDILVKGNKVYSPNTCCFVPREINNLFTKRNKGSLPIGVVSYGTKFKSQINKNGKRIYLGIYNTPQEAFHAYKTAKQQYVKELADKYFKEGKIAKKVYDALMKYEVEMTD